MLFDEKVDRAEILTAFLVIAGKEGPALSVASNSHQRSNHSLTAGLPLGRKIGFSWPLILFSEEHNKAKPAQSLL